MQWPSSLVQFVTADKRLRPKCLTKMFGVFLQYDPLLIQRMPISFNSPSCYTCTGAKREDDYSQDTDQLFTIQEKYWEPLIRERNAALEAKAKFKQGGKAMYEKYGKRFPNITEQEITDFWHQYQTLDMNGDGLLDYDEIGQVLDSSGDRSTVQRRREYFDKHLNADVFGAIDFEQFLDLVNTITADCEKESGGNGGKIERQNSGLLSGKRNLEILRKLSLESILNNELF